MKTSGQADWGVEWVRALHKRLVSEGRTVITCESCTGGLIGDWITNFPGSSEVYLGGVQSYSNELKMNLLGVPEAVLNESGAVSAVCAQAMAEGGLKLTGADYAIATTGIAGPGGGSIEKPVGLVYCAVAGPKGTVVEKSLWEGDSIANKHASALGALKRAVHYPENGELL